jgi:4-hydroxymandelate oxidase
MIWAPAAGELIKGPKDAINVFDFEPVAHKNVPPAHFGYVGVSQDKLEDSPPLPVMPVRSMSS